MFGKDHEDSKGRVGNFLVELKWRAISFRKMSAIFKNMQNIRKIVEERNNSLGYAYNLICNYR